MSDSLVAVVNGIRMGTVIHKGDRLSFLYDTSWQDSDTAFPLSLSMPLTVREHGHRVVDAFLWGLLPDNDGLLERWGRRFQVSSRNPFRLLQHVGEDCAGAVQFIRTERVNEFVGTGTIPTVQWLSEEELDARIAAVIADAAATRMGDDTGQFSLAGAQPKTALFLDPETQRWGVPEGRTPTTHILKPATGAFDGQVENEHFCLRLAEELGFPTANSWVLRIGGVPVIVVERYDRIRTAVGVRRIHQEDFCQAAGIRPQLKYQNQGGPTPRNIGEILWTSSSSPEEDVKRFAESLIFNWLVAGTDAHAKNYSILIAAGSSARLSPLYDLASSLPYPAQIQPRKATLAMKIGSHYQIQRIRRRDWEKMAREIRLSPAWVLERLSDMAGRLPSAAQTVANSLAKDGVRHQVIPRLVEDIVKHIEQCLAALEPSDPG